jgi:hypothetical protein
LLVVVAQFSRRVVQPHERVVRGLGRDVLQLVATQMRQRRPTPEPFKTRRTQEQRVQTYLGSRRPRRSVPLERREDADGEVRLAPSLDELDQCVQVIVGVLGDLGRESDCETRFHELLAPPKDDLIAAPRACRVRLHI